MNLGMLEKKSENIWILPPTETMNVPGVFYASEPLLRDMDDKVVHQVRNVACLPGIQIASYAMPDAHWGYGFPIGGVAAFDPDHGGVISAGGVGFDISCGVRALTTNLQKKMLQPLLALLADRMFQGIPAGIGKRSRGRRLFDMDEIDDMLAGGAVWAVQQGYGYPQDLTRTEEEGCMPGANPQDVSLQAKRRQLDEVGTLGSGNHYLEVQYVSEIFDTKVAQAFGIAQDDVLVMIHCGSRGLGHQIGTEYLRKMAVEAPDHGLSLLDRELASVPAHSITGQTYLGVMRAAINCALANRQVLTHEARRIFTDLIPHAELKVLYDVSHNTCKIEEHKVNGTLKKLYVHRKGATRAFGPNHPSLPPDLSAVGQPVLIGGSMGTCSYILVGTTESETLAFSSSCHGAGRSMSRHAAAKIWSGRDLIKALSHQGIEVRSMSKRGIAEEAPGAYKDVTDVITAADASKLSRKVAKLLPMICIKG